MNHRSGWAPILMIALSLSVLGGCHEEPSIVLVHDGVEPVLRRVVTTPLPAEPAMVDQTEIEPSPASAEAEPVRIGPTVAERSTPVVSPPSPEAVPVQIEFAGGDYMPRVQVHATLPDGTEVARDIISEDGRGLSRHLDRLRPHEYYSLRVWAEPLEQPFYDRVLRVDPEQPPRFFLGAVSVLIDESLRTAIAGGFRFVLRDGRTDELLFSGLLQDMTTYTIFDDALPMTLILEPGVYRYELIDENPDDRIGITDGAGGPGILNVEECRFEISRTYPAAQIDLRGIIGRIRDGGGTGRTGRRRSP